MKSAMYKLISLILLACGINGCSEKTTINSDLDIFMRCSLNNLCSISVEEVGIINSTSIFQKKVTINSCEVPNLRNIKWDIESGYIANNKLLKQANLPLCKENICTNQSSPLGWKFPPQIENTDISVSGTILNKEGIEENFLVHKKLSFYRGEAFSQIALQSKEFKDFKARGKGVSSGISWRKYDNIIIFKCPDKYKIPLNITPPLEGQERILYNKNETEYGRILRIGKYMNYPLQDSKTYKPGEWKIVTPSIRQSVAVVTCVPAMGADFYETTPS